MILKPIIVVRHQDDPQAKRLGFFARIAAWLRAFAR